MNGWMGLICLLACMWMVSHAVEGHTFGPREIAVLSAILLAAATKFLWAWNREAHKAYNKYLERQL